VYFKFLIQLFLAIAFIPANAQVFSARYKVTKQIELKDENDKTIVIDLPYSGFYFAKDFKVLSYIKPLYLYKYPDGYLKVNNMSYQLDMDSLQFLCYANLDSFILRRRIKKMVGECENILNEFEKGVMKWALESESKIKLGLTCKKATCHNPNTNKPYCEIWYSTEIPMPIGINNLLDVPGLIVEATFFNLSETYELLSYSFTESIPDEIFWPDEFNEPFIKKDKLKANFKPSTTSPAKSEKILDIINQ